jgi:hypothetical protein
VVKESLVLDKLFANFFSKQKPVASHIVYSKLVNQPMQVRGESGVPDPFIVINGIEEAENLLNKLGLRMSDVEFVQITPHILKNLAVVFKCEVKEMSFVNLLHSTSKGAESVAGDSKSV